MFRRATNRYGDTPEPVTPYQKAQQLWDERLGSARAQARNWRLMAFCCLVLSTGLAAGLIWQSAQGRVVPYVVEVDTLGGVQAVAPAVRPYEPTDAQITYHLARFVQDVRSLSIDPVVVRKSWLEAYDYATDRAAQALNAFARASDPFGAVGERTVSVDVTSVVRASDSSFQVKWTEQAWTNGSPAGTERWTGIFTVRIRQPRDAATLRKNPLGIYVHGLDWSREFNPGETP
ncbi:MAG: conjugal transfer protein TrbF [Gammaproteobacteria bacterium]|uniref:conjugal transfer protein TrbF n=1 Tax=Thalassobaculum sp. TaxID=2022740 RepID=UPI0032EC5DF0